MVFTDQLRSMLIGLTSGPTAVAEVEWYPGDRGHYDDSPTPAYLTMHEFGTYEPRIKVEHGDGLTTLLEVLDTTEQKVKEMQQGTGRPKYIIQRQDGDKLRLVQVM